MTKLTPPQARLLKALHDNGGSINCEDINQSYRKSVTALEKRGLCRWIMTPGYERSRQGAEITPKGIEALKGPIE